MAADSDIEENLFGCYMLYCLNEKYKGHTYIGYTVNPLRRIRQHNKGTQAGGAKRTSNRGPWDMVLLIHGFPNSIAALQFEWAWQHPQRSRRLQHVRRKRASETTFQYRFYIVSQMLRAGPWKQLPLTIRWLKQEYVLEFDPALRPPSHMPIVYGPVTSKKVSSPEKSQTEPSTSEIAAGALHDGAKLCAICQFSIKDPQNRLSCLNRRCRTQSHMTCLAEAFTGKRALLPVEGQCPACRVPTLWGDLIKHKNGCYQDLRMQVDDDDDDFDSDHWAAELHEA